MLVFSFTSEKAWARKHEGFEGLNTEKKKSEHFAGLIPKRLSKCKSNFNCTYISRLVIIIFSLDSENILYDHSISKQFYFISLYFLGAIVLPNKILLGGNVYC